MSKKSVYFQILYQEPAAKTYHYKVMLQSMQPIIMPLTRSVLATLACPMEEGLPNSYVITPCSKLT